MEEYMAYDLETHPTEQPQVVRVRRSTTDKVVAGVAGGLGRYLGIDPVLLRVAFVLLALSGGSGVLLYIIGWIAIPEEQPTDVLGPAPTGSSLAGRTIIGATVIAVGSVLLMSEFLPDLSKYLWPIGLVSIGVFIMLGGRK
jgi:phage shock protein C